MKSPPANDSRSASQRSASPTFSATITKNRRSIRLASAAIIAAALEPCNPPTVTRLPASGIVFANLVNAGRASTASIIVGKAINPLYLQDPGRSLDPTVELQHNLG